MAAAPAPASGAGGKGKRRRSLSEDDVYLLLHRYAPGTILTALQEVAQHSEGRRIDWRALVAKTTTGINSAREFQMLWRHFAYNHELAESVDASAAPLGDDSDIECELESVPNPGKEALFEASAVAKILISGSSREQASGHRVNLEAPALNSPNEKIVRVPSDKQLAQSHRLTNATGPVSNSKQTSHLGPSPDPLDANGANKKKKKPKSWSKEEDADLADGVQKYGQGKWLEILNNSNIDNARTPSQLCQRWMQMSKRPGSSKPLITTKQGSVANSEELKAAQKAFSIALDMPMGVKTVPRSGAQQQSTQHPSTVSGPMMHEVKSAAVPSAIPAPVPGQVPVAIPVPVKVQAQSPFPQGQQAPAQVVPPKVLTAQNKIRTNSKKQAALPNPTIGPSSIQAAAIAAGGRIATATTAAKFLKAAQSKNAVHIRSRVTGSSKPSTSSKAPIVVVESVTQHSGAQHLEPPNTIASISGPSVLATQAAQKLRVVSEVAAVAPGLSAGAKLLETKKTLSTAPVPALCSSEEKDGDCNFFAVTIDDLFPEEAIQPETHLKAREPDPVGPKPKQPGTVDPKVEEIVDSKDADMLEFDRFVAAQGGCVNMDLDKTKPVKSAPEGKGSLGCQKKQLKPVPAIGKSGHVSAGAPATGKRTRSPVSHLATPVPPFPPRGSVGTGNANAQNKTLGRKVAAPSTTGGQNPLPAKHVANSKGNQIQGNAAASPGIPASNRGNVVVNGVSKANTPSCSQGSTALNGASKANPPSSSPGSALGNVASKVNPRASSQGSLVANAANKANPPSSSNGSTVVNGASKANLPANGQGITVVNGPSKANPPASGQGTSVVNGASKVNPPASK